MGIENIQAGEPALPLAFAEKIEGSVNAPGGMMQLLGKSLGIFQQDIEIPASFSDPFPVIVPLLDPPMGGMVVLPISVPVARPLFHAVLAGGYMQFAYQTAGIARIGEQSGNHGETVRKRGVPVVVDVYRAGIDSAHEAGTAGSSGTFRDSSK